MRALIPAGLFALFGFWTGTFTGAATFYGAVVGQILLLLLFTASSPDWKDPLGLGSAGRWLLPALLGVVLASWMTSELPRAGRTAVALLPAFLLLAGALRNCWRDPQQKVRGLVGVGTVGGALAVVAFGGLALGASDRAALPLGHHNLLAAVLVVSLPLTWAAFRRCSGGLRLVLGVSAFLQLGAVLASRSLAAWAALAVAVSILCLAERRWRLALVGLVLILPAVPRGIDVLSGTDASASARATYARAAWAGIAERPGLGWGPGTTPWSLARHLEPVPGVNPPSEVVGEAHSLPLGLAYEIGVAGGLVAYGLVACFLLRRFRESRNLERGETVVRMSGVAALAAGMVTTLGASALSVPAIPVSWALAAAVALGTSRPARSRWGSATYSLLAAGMLVGPWAAHFYYDRAADVSEGPETARALERARELDPSFPLYAARLAWFQLGDGDTGAAVETSLEAARDAPGVAMLQLSAGVLGVEGGDPRALERLRRALELDPLSGLPPFYLAVAEPEAADWAACAARALLTEPALAASTYWDSQLSRLPAVRAEILGWSGIDAGLREELALRLERRAVGGGEAGWWPVGSEAERGDLSRYAFRRSPWRREWFAEPVNAALVEDFDLPAASSIAGTSRAALPARGCAPEAGFESTRD